MNRLSSKIAVVSLGCDKNRIDTERMLGSLAGGGYTVTGDYAEADIIIVNTCAFIESARREAIDTILEMARYKREGRCKRLVVTGCLPQKYLAALKEGLPEVDAFLGVGEYDKIAAAVGGEDVPPQRAGKRILTTPPHYAYLRIADGCDNFCTFCTIPSIRGKYKSVPIEELVEEAKTLESEGVKELILVAQDVTAYGHDLYGEPSLLRLLKALTRLDFHWIRLMYCYPELMTDALVKEIATNPKIAKYVDVPMQHVADGVLRRMNRRSSRARLEELCTLLRENGIALRTTFMVGFPGETDEDFKALADFTEKFRPERVGIFAYSKESDTPSARLAGQVPARIKAKRVEALGEIVKRNIARRNAELVGKTIEVVYEDMDYDRGMFVGRAEWDAPEVDCVVRFTGDFADVGNFYKVKITGFDDYDLTGVIER